MSEQLEAAKSYLALRNGPPKDWEAVCWSIIRHLEAQQETPASPATSPTTAKVTMAALWAAGMPTERLHSREREEASAMADTGPRTRLLRRVHGVLTEAELTHAVQCSTCADLLAASLLLLSTHVPAAAGTTSTLVSEASRSFAVASGSATSPSPASSDPSPESAAQPGRERCHADRDGDCDWQACPQLRDGEPKRTKRDCPLDVYTDNDL